MKKLWIAAFLILLFGGCANQPAEAELVVPTGIHTPTHTATPVPTATPTALVLADHENQMEPYPDLEVITAENVNRLEEVDVWGKGTVMGIALSPDASTIAVSTPTGIYFYDADSMEQIDWIDFYVIRTDCGFNNCGYTYDNLDYSPDGKSLLIGFDDLYVIDLETRDMSRFVTEETDMERSYIMEAEFSKNGNHILFTRSTTTVHGSDVEFNIYEVNSTKQVYKYGFSIQKDYAPRIYMPDDNTVIIDQIVVDISNGLLLRKDEKLFTDAVNQIISFTAISDGQWQATLRQENYSCDFTEDFSTVFTYGMYDFSEDMNTLIAFDDYYAEKLTVRHFEPCQENTRDLMLPGWSRNIAISTNGNYIITRRAFQHLWDVYTGEIASSVIAWQMAFNVDDSQLFGMVQINSDESDSCRTVIKNLLSDETVFQIDSCTSFEFELNPEDEQIFIVENVLVNLHKTDPVIKDYSAYPYQFSPDGKYVVYLVKQRSNRNAFLYFDDTTNGELIPTETKMIAIPSSSSINNAGVIQFRISPSGRYISFYGDGKNLVWDNYDEEFISIDDEMDIGGIKYFPYEELFLISESGYGEPKLRMWDTKTEQVVYDFLLPENLSAGPVISPDGKFLAFLGYDHTIRIYGVRSETK